MFKGEFKTAYLQREIPENAIVADEIVVGELVKITPAAGSVPAIVNKLVATTEAAALSEATNIMAQSDMTLGYGHVPVENRDYRYSADIAASIDLTKLGPVYYGVFASTASLPSTGLSANDTAMVVDATNGVIDKYIASGSPTLSWGKATSTAAYSVSIAAATKHIASFKITNKDDVIVRDAG